MGKHGLRDSIHDLYGGGGEAGEGDKASLDSTSRRQCEEGPTVFGRASPTGRAKEELETSEGGRASCGTQLSEKGDTLAFSLQEKKGSAPVLSIEDVGIKGSGCLDENDPFTGATIAN